MRFTLHFLQFQKILDDFNLSLSMTFFAPDYLSSSMCKALKLKNIEDDPLAVRLVYTLSSPKELSQPPLPPKKIDIRPLAYNEKWADFAIEQWKFKGSHAKEYQRDMFDKGLIFGAFCEKKLIGGLSIRR